MMHTEFRFNEAKRLEIKPTSNDEMDMLMMLMKQGPLEVVFKSGSISDGIVIQPLTKEVFRLKPDGQ